MIYDWACANCHQTTEVTRALQNYEVPPDAGCEHCGSTDLSRIITRPAGLKGFVLEGEGWEFDGYRKTRPKPKRRDGFG